MEGHPGGGSVPWGEYATGVIRRHPPQRRITAGGYSPYQAHVPHWKATLEGAPFRGANTPPALSAGIRRNGG